MDPLNSYGYWVSSSARQNISFSANESTYDALMGLASRISDLRLGGDTQAKDRVALIESLAKTVFMPAEVLHRILSFLDVYSMARLSATSRFYRQEIAKYPEFSVRALWLRQIAEAALNALETELEKSKEIVDLKEKDWKLYNVIRSISLFSPKAFGLVDLISEPRFKEHIQSYVLCMLGRKDPEKAHSLIGTLRIERNVTECSLFVNLGRKDIKKAVALALKMENIFYRYRTFSELLNIAIKSSSKHLRIILSDILKASTHDPDHYRYYIIEKVAEDDWLLATEASASIADDDLKTRILLKYASNHPFESHRFFDQLRENKPALAKLYLIYAKALREDQIQALRYVDEAVKIVSQLVDEEEKTRMSRQIISTTMLIDFNLACNMLKRQPGILDDNSLFHAICELAKLVPCDLEKALELMPMFRRPYYKYMTYRKVIPKLMPYALHWAPALIEQIESVDGIEWIWPHLRDTLYGKLAAFIAKNDLNKALKILETIEHPPEKLAARIRIALAIESANPTEAKKIIAETVEQTKGMEFNNMIQSQIQIARLLQKNLRIERISPPYTSFCMKDDWGRK